MIKNSFSTLVDPWGFVNKYDPDLCGCFETAIDRILNALVGDTKKVDTIKGEWMALLGESWTNEVESDLIKRFRAPMADLEGFAVGVNKQLDIRANTIAGEVEQFVKGRNILDWGCGDARVAREISNSCAKLSLLDIVDVRQFCRDNPFFLYNEKSGYASNPGRVDSVLLLTVLHHSQMPGRVIRDVASLEPDNITVIESVPLIPVPENYERDHPEVTRQLRFDYCAFTDWLYNRVLCEDVQVTYNFLMPSAWNQMFLAAGYEIESRVDLGIDIDIVPEWHVLLHYRKL